MRHLVTTTIFAAALALAPLSTAFAQSNPSRVGPSAGGQSGGSGGPMVEQTGRDASSLSINRAQSSAPGYSAGSLGDGGTGPGSTTSGMIPGSTSLGGTGSVGAGTGLGNSPMGAGGSTGNTTR